MKIEHLILKNIIHNEEYCRSVIPFLKDEYFHDYTDKNIYKLISAFVNTYKSRPSSEAISLMASESKKIKTEDTEVISSLLSTWDKDKENTSLQFLLKQTEEFCKEKALHNAVLDSIKIISDEKDSRDKGVIPEILKDALSISFDPSVGHDFIDSASDRYEFYHKKEERIPFDIANLNLITNGGLPKKTLNILVAGVNVGKSLAMCHMAAANLIQNKNVLYITCEMAEERIAERIDANVLDISLETLKQISKNQFMKLINSLKFKTSGRLIVKEYPTSTANASHFRYLLHELAIKKNFVPDIIYIDYLNICSSSRIKNTGAANSYTLVKSIAEEIRGLAVEMAVPIVTATQFTRCLSVGSLIKTKFGVKRIDTLSIGDQILGDSGWVEVKRIYPKETKKVYRIKTESGKFIDCSDTHIFPTSRGMLSIQSGLVEGDNLFSATQ